MGKRREGRDIRLSATFQSKCKLHRRHLVEIDRPAKGMDRSAGFVVACSDVLVLLHALEWDAFRLNGYIAVQIADIGAYRFFDKADYWQFRAVKRFKLVPTRPPSISVDSWPDLISSAGARYPLLTIHRERIDPETCAIGSLAAVGASSFTIEDLDCTAAWTGPRRLKFSDVTRVDFDGGYLEALAAVARFPS